MARQRKLSLVLVHFGIGGPVGAIFAAPVAARDFERLGRQAYPNIPPEVDLLAGPFSDSVG
jgi:hypothetical protein